jgi:hypothetical protein
VTVSSGHQGKPANYSHRMAGNGSQSRARCARTAESVKGKTPLRSGGQPAGGGGLGAAASLLAKLPACERDAAHHMLVQLGLFYYFKESHSASLNINTLYDLCGASVIIHMLVHYCKISLYKQRNAFQHPRVLAG